MTLMFMICTNLIRVYQLNQCYPRPIEDIPTLDSHL